MHGAGAPRRIPVASGCGGVDCAPDLLRAADPVGEGQASGGDAEGREGVTTVETWRVKNLQHEVKELRRTIGVLKQASDFFSQAQLDR